MSVLQTIDLKKYYGTEPNITRALDGVNFSVNIKVSERCNISPRFSMNFFGRCNISRTLGFYNTLINKSEEATQWN